MPSADQVPVKTSHSTMRWHEWVVLIAGSTGSTLRAVCPPNLHIAPDAQRDLVTPQARRDSCNARPSPSWPRPSARVCWQARWQLIYLGSTPTEKQPRGFNIDPTGQFSVVSGEKSDMLAVYSIANRLASGFQVRYAHDPNGT